jgi:hypothetical protein
VLPEPQGVLSGETIVVGQDLANDQCRVNAGAAIWPLAHHADDSLLARARWENHYRRGSRPHQ